MGFGKPSSIICSCCVGLRCVGKSGNHWLKVLAGLFCGMGLYGRGGVSAQVFLFEIWLIFWFHPWVILYRKDQWLQSSNNQVINSVILAYLAWLT